MISIVTAAGGASAHAVAPAPHAAGDATANVPLDTAAKRVMTRWVARHTGDLDRLYLHVKVEGSDECPYGGRPGYAKGTTGVLRATTHPVLADGRPDLSRTLSTDQFSPCPREERESIDIDMHGLSVRAGDELATVIRNVDPDPAANYFSINFLYVVEGVVGANGRNERDPAAADVYYGLDPRELVGYSADGERWSLPGGPYGRAAGRNFLPTYIQAYADGRRAGQAYYSSRAVSGPVRMTYPAISRRWRITQLGAYVGAPGEARVDLLVDGVRRGTAVLSGSGMLREPIEPVTAPAGSTVVVATTAGEGGLALRKHYGDSVWAGLMGFGTGFSYFFDGDPRMAVPVYPLPRLDHEGAATAPRAPKPGAVERAPGDESSGARAQDSESSVSLPSRVTLERLLRRGLPVRVKGSGARAVGAALVLDRGGAKRYGFRGSARRKGVVVSRKVGLRGASAGSRFTIRLGAKAARRFRSARRLSLTASVEVADRSGRARTVRKRVNFRARG